MTEELLENPVTGESIRVLESTKQTFRAQYSLRAHGTIPGGHFHPYGEQRLSVLAGEMHLRVNGEHHIVRSGQTITMSVAARHFQWNPCDTEAVVIEEVQPPARMHDFFKVLFGLARDGKTDRNGFPSPILAAALFSEFKDSIRPASLSLRLMVGALGPIALAFGYRRHFDRYLHGARVA